MLCSSAACRTVLPFSTVIRRPSIVSVTVSIGEQQPGVGSRLQFLRTLNQLGCTNCKRLPTPNISGTRADLTTARRPPTVFSILSRAGPPRRCCSPYPRFVVRRLQDEAEHRRSFARF